MNYPVGGWPPSVLAGSPVVIAPFDGYGLAALDSVGGGRVEWRRGEVDAAPYGASTLSSSRAWSFDADAGTSSDPVGGYGSSILPVRSSASNSPRGGIRRKEDSR